MKFNEPPHLANSEFVKPKAPPALIKQADQTRQRNLLLESLKCKSLERGERLCLRDTRLLFVSMRAPHASHQHVHHAWPSGRMPCIDQHTTSCGDLVFASGSTGVRLCYMPRVAGCCRQVC